MTSRNMIRCLIPLLVLLACSSVRAQEPPTLTPEEQKLTEEAAHLNDEAVQLLQRGRPTEALVKCRQSLEIRRQLYPAAKYPDGHADLAQSLNNMGSVLKTMSQAEHSALFFREAGHTRFVGTPTQGANGDVTSMVAPGAVHLSFSGEGVRHVDGSQLQRVGILPDVRVSPTASDIAAGNDVVLQSGLNEALRVSGASPSLRKAAVRQEVARERAAAARP